MSNNNQSQTVSGNFYAGQINEVIEQLLVLIESVKTGTDQDKVTNIIQNLTSDINTIKSNSGLAQIPLIQIPTKLKSLRASEINIEIKRLTELIDSSDAAASATATALQTLITSIFGQEQEINSKIFNRVGGNRQSRNQLQQELQVLGQPYKPTKSLNNVMTKIVPQQRV